MAAPEDNCVVLQLDEEEEGDHMGSDDYYFVGIGEPVPIKHGDDPEYDLERPPLRPLAVSERHGLVFVAHSNGFCVSRTKDVIESAKEIKEKGSGSSLKELSVIDVQLGKVYILSLSANSSTLAACVGGDIHLFSVSSLLNKEESKLFSSSLPESRCVKDMRWTKKLGNHYIVLSDHGNLYCGSGQDHVGYVMDNVDAVEWNGNENLVAVARKNILSVLSSDFKQKFSMCLPFKSLDGDPGSNYDMKVDSIMWVRADCIILGCLQVTADGEEENYTVQVITSRDGKIADASSSPFVSSFSDVFEGLVDDIVPFGSGPYMTMSYLNRCELAITTNRKCTDQHIALFGWPLENEKKKVAVIDIMRDTFCPKISLQASGDDNLVLGLCLEKILQDEKVEVEIGKEYKELSPFCILLCLSFDGKLFMFQVASFAGAPVTSDSSSVLSEEEDDTPTASYSGIGFSERSSDLVVQSARETGVGPHYEEVNKKEDYIKGGLGVPLQTQPYVPKDTNSVTTSSSDELSANATFPGTVSTPAVSLPFGNSNQQNFPDSKTNQDKGNRLSPLYEQPSTGLAQSPFTTYPSDGKGPLFRGFTQTETLKHGANGGNPGSISGNFLADKSSQAIPTTLTSKELPRKLGSANSSGALTESSLSGKYTHLNSSGGSSMLPTSSTKSNLPNNFNTSSTMFHLPGGSSGNMLNTKEAAGLSAGTHSFGKSANLGGQITSSATGLTEPLPATRDSPVPSRQSFTLGQTQKDKIQSGKDDNRSVSSTKLLNAEPYHPKQIGNVEEMIKELEKLLQCIEGVGGFVDACTVHQKSSVLALEDGTESLFSRCRLWKNSMEQHSRDVQLLLDDTVQVLARKTYMEGIFKQAHDGQYWDLWSRQKLCFELELKRRNICTLNQELTNQLIKLEMHLNALELNKFGGNDGVEPGQRALPSRFGSSRRVQSLHRLHNTMSSQLAAAEHLSECLSKQMAVLRIEPPSVKKQNVKREMFEAIGIPFESGSFSSPDSKIVSGTPSDVKYLTSSRSDAIKGLPSRNSSSAIRNSESETTRRRRDSLDRNWATFEPPKTTIKRMHLYEEKKASAQKSSLRVDKSRAISPHLLDRSAVPRQDNWANPSTILYPYEEKGIVGRQTKQASEVTLASSQMFSDRSGSLSKGLNSLETQVSPVNNFPASSSKPGSYPSTITRHNSTTASRGVSLLSKPSSVFANETPSSQTFGSGQAPSVSKTLLGQQVSSPKKASEVSYSFEKGTNLLNFSSENVKHSSNTRENLIPAASKDLSVVDSAPNLNTKILQSNTVASRSQSDKLSSSSSSTFLLSTSSTSSSPATQSLFRSGSHIPTLPPESSTISTSKSSSSKPIDSDRQTSFLSQSSASSSHFISPVSSFDGPGKPVPSTFSVPSINFGTASPKTEQDTPTAEVSTKENPSTKSLQPKSDTASTSKPESSVLSASTSQPPISSQPGTKLSFNSMPPPPSNASTFSFGPVQPPAADPSPKADVSATSESLGSGVSASNNNPVTQEDEMEEEAPETNQAVELTLGSLGGFGIGSAPNPANPKPNPFGATFGNASPNTGSSLFNKTVPTGELFRPASFSFQSPQPSQTSQPPNFGQNTGGFGTGNTLQTPAGMGFGQPSQIGSGQQALGTVLGAFGQSRQLGLAQPGAGTSSGSGFGGGFGSSHSTGGFSGIASGGGGFASLASAGGGFASLASAGGGFGAAASAGGGFASLAAAGGGFGAASPAGGGFAGAAASGGGGFAGAASGGGFGGFSSQQPGGGGGFSAFGSNVGGAGTAASPLFTQMRK